MKKQVLSLLMVMLLVFGSLTGCSGGGNSSGDGESSTAAENSAQEEVSQGNESQGGSIENMNAVGLPIVNDQIELSIFQ